MMSDKKVFLQICSSIRRISTSNVQGLVELIIIVVVVVAAEFCRVDSSWPEKIRVRSGYVDPTVMETEKIILVIILARNDVG